MKTRNLLFAVVMLLACAVAALAADPAAVVVPAAVPAATPEPALISWFVANKAAVFGALLALSELLSLIPAFKGNGLLDTVIKGLQTLSGKEQP